jgi:peptide/nickel transport system substrate-binding protein
MLMRAYCTTLFAATSLLLCSCGGGKKEKKAENQSNVVVYHTIGEPDGMHPVNDNSGPRTEICNYTQIYLVNTDVKNNQPLPYLAAELPAISEDGKVYTYKLRNDMKWDDESPVTAEDVVFTFKVNKCALANNPHTKPYLDNIVDVQPDAGDKNKVVFRMKDRYIQNIWMLTDFPILQRKFFDPADVLGKYSIPQFDNKKFNAEKEAPLMAWFKEFNSAKYSRDIKFITGAGPYRLAAWEPGQSITLEKKKKHWSEGKKGMYEIAGPEKIVIVINREPNSYMLEFKKQKYDASTYIEIKALMELEKSQEFTENYNYAFLPTYSYSYIAINLKPDGVKHKQLFTDPRVRKALAMLTPADDMNKVIYKGKAKRLAGPVSPLKNEYNQALQPIPYDIEGAKKLLAEAGWRDGDGDGILEKKIGGEVVKMEFDIQYMATAPSWKDMAEMSAESFYKAGVKARPKAVDFNVALDNLKNHDFDMLVSAWQGVAAPEDHKQIWSTESWATKGSNFTGWGSAASDALIDSMNHELDEGKRTAMSKRFQKMVYDDQPYIFLFSSVRRIAIHKRFGKQEMYYDRQAILLNHFQIAGASPKPVPNN